MGLFDLLRDGLFGDDEGDGPTWPWAANTWDRWDQWVSNPTPDDDGDQ